MLTVAIVVFVFLFVPQTVKANDYLEKEKHYRVYTSGPDRIHFDIPVWAYGKSYDYHAYGDSYIAYKKNGSDTWTTIAWYKSDAYAENEDKGNTKGTAYIKLLNNQGAIVVTSMYNGVNYRVSKIDDWTEKLIVKQKEDDGTPQVTNLEFDWYPPESLDSISFDVKIESKFKRSYTVWGENAMTTSCIYEGFTNNNNIMTPQLYTPYIYQVNEGGPTGYGYAAIPYMTFNDPISYTTSIDPSVVPISDRGGTMYVMTTDTVQEQFKATFKMWRGTGDAKTETERTSVGVDIPPYHRIYDFKVVEERDSTGTFTGNNVLSWNIKNPELKDLVDGDYFEVQRAMQSDFSDATTIEMFQMVRNENKSNYTYVDNNRSTWTGNAADVTADTHLSVHDNKFVVYDNENNPFVELDVKLTSDSLLLPSVPVYYRMRRASSSVWGWEQDFAKSASLLKHNFLAPLADEQEQYTLDSDYRNNHKVNFRFKIENREVMPSYPKKEECTMTYNLNRVLREDNIELTILFQNDGICNSPEGKTAFRVTDIDGKVLHDWSYLSAGTYMYPANTILQVKNTDPETYNEGKITTFNLVADSEVKCTTEWRMAVQEFFAYFTQEGDGKIDIMKELETYLPSVKDSLYKVLLIENNTEHGRCMWDRTAQLILTRTIEETGQRKDIVIPQDSISRLSDGSWIVTYSDIADKACSHYKYSIHIDQSKSDLRVQDSALLKPIQILGPELYYDEGAAVRNFTASQGDAGTQFKNGVLLRWETNNNNYDDFVLLRQVKDSTNAADTLVITDESNYFDRSAMPDVHYEYTIEARYSCNGKTTANSATTEGWRTPYGEISGAILMPDNTGMAGVEVALQDTGGNTIRKVITDASGAYKFDSLDYEAIECSDPKVLIKYTNTVYSNNPEPYTLIRVSDKDGHRLQDWTNMPAGTYSYPMGTTLEVKTTETDNSNYDVIFSFVIETGCTLNCYNNVTTVNMFQRKGRFSPYISSTSDIDCYTVGSSLKYIVIPTSQYGIFSFNNTNTPTATITLSPNNAVASGMDFVNTSTTRLTGRVLYKNTTIPVSGAMFLLNGDTVRRGNIPLTSATNGNFELVVPLNQTCRLQVIKAGHTFEGDGILRIDDKEEFSLTKPLDGVRFFDMTKVRLIGRVAGGNDQRDLPRGFGLGTNNLGDNLQLVLQLEGDNTAQIVHDPEDLDKDTIQQTQQHYVYSPDMEDSISVGTTQILFEKKRIIINPDPRTGEFEVDLFPVKYKVVQATAVGYATLFSAEQGNETFDLTNAPHNKFTDNYTKSMGTPTIEDVTLHEGDSIFYNAVYDRIYHTPMQVDLTQMIYGLVRDGLGEPSMEVSDIDPSLITTIKLYEKNQDNTIDYLLGYPVFIGGRKYQFIAQAYEDYYYNNDSQTGRLDRVPLRGGAVTIHNGLHDSKSSQTYALDSQGRNQSIWLMVDNYDVNNVGTNALRTVTAALEQGNNIVETTLFSGYITGTVVQEKDLRMTDSKIVLLDIIRDPGGAGSSAWIESGSTYSYSYKENYKWDVGVTINLKYGLNVSIDVGVVSSFNGAGMYQGSNYTTSKQLNMPIPIKHSWDWGYQYDYSITTNERISTSSASAAKNVGAMADVFFGTTIAQVAGKAKTVTLINDSLYHLRKPAIDAGAMKVIASGTAADGQTYHLVTGQKIVLGSTLNSNFAYSQHYILNTVIPEIAMERQSLLMQFSSIEEAKQVANQRGEEIYWYHPLDTVTLRDSLPDNYYEMVTPDDDKVYTDRVAALDNVLIDWLTILYQNEEEKVAAMGTNSKKVGTYSVSYGSTVNHTETYSASSNYNEVPQGWGLIGSDAATGASNMGKAALNNLANNLKDFWKSRNGSTFGQAAIDALYDYQHTEDREDGGYRLKTGQEMGTVTNSSKFSFSFDPVFNFSNDTRESDTKRDTKSAGFNIVSDPDGDITVSAYRVPYSDWAKTTAFIRDRINTLPEDDDNLYGSYVFYTDAGATFCPHEGEERTNFYNKGTLIGNGTQWLVKPEMTANTYEITNVQPQNSAYFQITIMDNSEIDAGVANDGHGLTLYLDGESNPNGAVLTIDGMSLVQGVSLWVVPGRPVTKTLRVERGTVDDYDNLTLLLSVSDCMKTLTSMNLSVHFLPLSSDVNIAMPRQNWVMNTLSSQDSVGYYIPIDIDGFDINHKNFDHIEFQYKLSTQSEEMWVNQCSFFASDSLYQLATGNKAMIENGRIVPFRFYGERDPMEQKYDLRAVSFCRYGSGFVTKSSPVISGTKDTRPPRIFGEPEPANAILGIGDNLKLRFNEAIAGNYLDEDNNFQIKGVTNSTGITTSTSVHFSGMPDSYAKSQVSRSLSNRSFSIDMLVKPSQPSREQVFFEHGENGNGVRFGLTADNRLQLMLGTFRIYSKPLETMLSFTRVGVIYDNETNEIRFFAGTSDVTDPQAHKLPATLNYNISAPLIFGRGFEGNMLELRLWSKALTLEDIAATHMHYLTGYERELVAYYPMTEGKGNTLKDKSAGATLTLYDASWNLPQGISLAIDNNQTVSLNGNLLSRSEIYDETLMFWFRPTSTNGDIFTAGYPTDSTGTVISIVDNLLVLHSGRNTIFAGEVTPGTWQHFVLTVNRTYNNASVFLNGRMTASFAATQLEGISGAMYFGGNGFEGNIDEFVIFEQALPKTLVEEFGIHSPYGDEMGLMAYLPFETQKMNPNGVLELVFSINDQRVFYDDNGKEIDKEIPLIIESQNPQIESMADKILYAPVYSTEPLSKLNFDWAFNNDELLINLKMQDREINKQTVFVTVRDVEDLNGNPMPSPVTWVAYVDRNNITWENNTLEIWRYYNNEDAYECGNENCHNIRIINNSGKKHQFTIESLPEWLTVDQSYGTIHPLEYHTVRLTYNTSLSVGNYSDLVYVTDENGLSEPLKIIYHVTASCPWQEPDKAKYALNMSLCGQVLVNGEYDTDNNDKVIATYKNECVGMANINFNNLTNTSNVYLTIYGNESMNNKRITFQLWQASTGKVITLSSSVDVKFAHGNVFGCGYEEPVIFSTSGSEVQNINLNPGWNWTSFNINVNADATGVINNVMTASQPWTEGDLIKNPVTRNFCVYSDSLERFVGSLYHYRYIYSHMVFCKNGNTMRISGNTLPADSMYVVLQGNGQWSPLPCLYKETTPLLEALADYYDFATPGDLVKSHDHFAVFSQDKRWEGDLTALRPGEGYYFRRLGEGPATLHYYDIMKSSLQQTDVEKRNLAGEEAFTNPDAANNMTIIAALPDNVPQSSRLLVFVADELSARAQPHVVNADTIYFLTVQSDNVGELRFCTENGTQLVPQSGRILNQADAHYGSLSHPLQLIPLADSDDVYKIIENDHVIIIRHGVRYDVTGRKLTE